MFQHENVIYLLSILVVFRIKASQKINENIMNIVDIDFLCTAPCNFSEDYTVQ